MSSSTIHWNRREERAFHRVQKDYFCFLNVMEECNSRCLKTKILIQVCRLRQSEWERKKSLELLKFYHSVISVTSRGLWWAECMKQNNTTQFGGDTSWKATTQNDKKTCSITFRWDISFVLHRITKYIGKI